MINNASMKRMYSQDELTDFVDEKIKNKVDKVEGKGLSANDFTNELKAKYDGYESQLLTTQNIFNLFYPINKVVVQYSASDNPNDLYNNDDISSTWEKIEADEEYIQFDSTKDAGSAVSEELPSPSIAENGEHKHTIRSAYGSAGDAYSFEYTHPKASAWTEGQGETSFAGKHSHDVNEDSVYKNGGKVHPKGFTATLWIRTA